MARILIKVLSLGVIILTIILLFAAFIIKGVLVFRENADNSSQTYYIDDNLFVSSDDIILNDGIFLSISKAKLYKGELKTSEFEKAAECNSATVGNTIAYLLYYSGDIHTFNFTSGHIGLCGFAANVKIFPTLDNPNNVLVILENIKAPYSEDEMLITINGGTAIGHNGELSNGIKSETIKIYQKNYYRFFMWILRESEAISAFLGAIIALYVGIFFSGTKQDKQNNVK